jgi:membrane fusion protein (multidrug efflux system)
MIRSAMNRIMTHKKKLFITVFLILITGFFTFKSPHSQNEEAVVVAVKQVRSAIVSPTVSVIGTISAEQGVDVSARINGIISGIYFQSGQDIKKGDLLVSLENDELKAKVDQSIEKLKLARQNYDRNKKLNASGVISHSDFDKLTETFAEDKLEVDYETAMLNQTYIRAPFDGKVSIQNINQGQYISAGQLLVNIQNLSSLFVNFDLSEQYINKVELGSLVQVIDDSDEKNIVNAKIVAIGSKADTDTRTLPIRAQLEVNRAQKIFPGMYREAKVSLTNKAKVILVPQTAVVYDQLGNSVYRVSNHHPEQVKVMLGEQIGDEVEILKGLSETDTVVCAGQIKLHPGVVVNEVPYQTELNHS